MAVIKVYNEILLSHLVPSYVNNLAVQSIKMLIKTQLFWQMKWPYKVLL